MVLKIKMKQISTVVVVFVANVVMETIVILWSIVLVQSVDRAYVNVSSVLFQKILG